MRRREAGRGVAPARLVRKRVTRAASGLRPGPLRVPARSWLTNWVGVLPGFALLSIIAPTGKRGPMLDRRRDWRAERRPPGSATDPEP
jgi:hypothetical protein